jgi:hypothetical protein
MILALRAAAVSPLALLAACAGMQEAARPAMPVTPMAVTAPMVSPDAARSEFVASQREQARRSEADGMLTRARDHWRYVMALAPDGPEARQEIGRLDTLIRTRRDAALAQGEAAMMRGRTAEAQTAFLRALALDGTNAQARRRLTELETRAAFVRQERKDARARAAERTAGTESPEDEQQ